MKMAERQVLVSLAESCWGTSLQWQLWQTAGALAHHGAFPRPGTQLCTRSSAGSSRKKPSGGQGLTLLTWALTFQRCSCRPQHKHASRTKLQYTVFHCYNWESQLTYLSYTKAALASWNHGGSGQYRGSSNPWDLHSSDFASIVTVLKRLKFTHNMINSSNRHSSQATTWQRTKGISRSIEAWAPRSDACRPTDLWSARSDAWDIQEI